MIGFARTRAACWTKSTIVAFIGLAAACPAVLAQDQAVAPAGAEDVPSSEPLDFSMIRTEGPRETFGSFLRLKDELEMRVSSYLQDHSRADFDRLTATRDLAEQLLDLSAVPEAAKDKVGTGVVLIASWGLHKLGVPASGLLTGLGIGGAAVGLAVQPALINLVAGLTLYREKAIRVGDFVRFGDLEGQVETIGVRSTRIRAPDQTLISVPNSNLVSAEVANWGYSNRMEIRLELNLSDQTAPDQMRWVLVKLREMLLAHPKIESDTVRVRFAGYGDDSMDISMRVFALTADWNDYYAIREDMLLRVKDIVQESGTGFSTASQIEYLKRSDGPDDGRAKQAVEQVAAWRQSGQLPFPEFSRKEREQIEDTLDYPPTGSPEGGKE